MTFELSKFGNGVDTGSGGNVNTALGKPHNSFNARPYGQQIGVDHSENGTVQVTMTLTADQLVRDAATNDGFLLTTTIPAGALIRNILVQTKAAITMTGTTPTILVGTEGSEVTNGFVISATQASTPGAYVETGVGTWSATTPLAAATVIGVALGGTTPVVTSTGGQIDVLIEYIRA